MQRNHTFKLKGSLHVILLKGVLFRGNLHIDFNLLLLQYLYFVSFNTKNKRNLE